MTDNSFDRLANATVYDNSGDKIGKLGTLYVDNDSGQPSFATVSTGLFGMSESFVPLQGAQLGDDDVRVAYTKDQVKDAPRIDAGGDLSPAEEDRLYSHYGLTGGGAATGRTDRATVSDDDVDARVKAGTTGQSREGGHEATDTVTAHEERLNVGTRTEETGRVRLRKYTTTETENVEVPVSKEKLVVEREDAGGTVRKGGLDEVSDGEHVEEITLREERPVVEKETVERERLRVGKEKVTDTETVSDQLRTEHIDVEGDVTGDRGGRGHRDDRPGTADGR